MLVATHGLVTLNAKWKDQSDQAFYAKGNEQIEVTRQLFHIKKEGFVIMLAIEIVDDVLSTGKDDAMRSFIFNCNSTFHLDKAVFGPGEPQILG